jgi:hypothetical protein
MPGLQIVNTGQLKRSNIPFLYAAIAHKNLLKLNAILSTDNHMHTWNGHTYKWAEKAAVFIDK